MSEPDWADAKGTTFTVRGRAGCHAAYNGGYHDPETNAAYHRGMDTVWNMLEGGSLAALLREVAFNAHEQGATTERRSAVEADIAAGKRVLAEVRRVVEEVRNHPDIQKYRNEWAMGWTQGCDEILCRLEKL